MIHVCPSVSGSFLDTSGRRGYSLLTTVTPPPRAQALKDHSASLLPCDGTQRSVQALQAFRIAEANVDHLRARAFISRHPTDMLALVDEMNELGEMRVSQLRNNVMP